MQRATKPSIEPVTKMKPRLSVWPLIASWAKAKTALDERFLLLISSALEII
jgi:hypothetical protein